MESGNEGQMAARGIEHGCLYFRSTVWLIDGESHAKLTLYTEREREQSKLISL
jgi:hypothetical protein